MNKNYVKSSLKHIFRRSVMLAKHVLGITPPIPTKPFDIYAEADLPKHPSTLCTCFEAGTNMTGTHLADCQWMAVACLLCDGDGYCPCCAGDGLRTEGDIRVVSLYYVYQNGDVSSGDHILRDGDDSVAPGKAVLQRARFVVNYKSGDI